jgi:hypothetical protein
VFASIEPQPSEPEREAILAALAQPASEPSEWAEAALLEGVDAADPEP